VSDAGGGSLSRLILQVDEAQAVAAMRRLLSAGRQMQDEGAAQAGGVAGTTAGPVQGKVSKKSTEDEQANREALGYWQKQRDEITKTAREAESGATRVKRGWENQFRNLGKEAAGKFSDSIGGSQNLVALKPADLNAVRKQHETLAKQVGSIWDKQGRPGDTAASRYMAGFNREITTLRKNALDAQRALAPLAIGYKPISEGQYKGGYLATAQTDKGELHAVVQKAASGKRWETVASDKRYAHSVPSFTGRTREEAARQALDAQRAIGPRRNWENHGGTFRPTQEPTVTNAQRNQQSVDEANARHEARLHRLAATENEKDAARLKKQLALPVTSEDKAQLEETKKADEARKKQHQSPKSSTLATTGTTLPPTQAAQAERAADWERGHPQPSTTDNTSPPTQTEQAAAAKRKRRTGGAGGGGGGRPAGTYDDDSDDPNDWSPGKKDDERRKEGARRHDAVFRQPFVGPLVPPAGQPNPQWDTRTNPTGQPSAPFSGEGWGSYRGPQFTGRANTTQQPGPPWARGAPRGSWENQPGWNPYASAEPWNLGGARAPFPRTGPRGVNPWERDFGAQAGDRANTLVGKNIQQASTIFAGIGNTGAVEKLAALDVTTTTLVASMQLLNEAEVQQAALIRGAKEQTLGRGTRFQRAIHSTRNYGPTSTTVAAEEQTGGQFGSRHAINTLGYALPGIAIGVTFEELRKAVTEAAEAQKALAEVQAEFEALGQGNQFQGYSSAIQNIASQTGVAVNEVADLSLQMKGVFTNTGQAETALLSISEGIQALGVPANVLQEDLTAISQAFDSLRKQGGQSFNTIQNQALHYQDIFGVPAGQTLAGTADIAAIGQQLGLSNKFTMGLVAATAQRTGQSGTDIGEQFAKILPSVTTNAEQILSYASSLGKTGQPLVSAYEGGNGQQIVTQLLKLVSNPQISSGAQYALISALGGNPSSRGLLLSASQAVGSGGFIPKVNSVSPQNRLQEEFNKQMSTMLGEIERAGSALANLGVDLLTSPVGKILEGVVAAGRDVVTIFGDLDRASHDIVGDLLAAGVAYKALTALYGVAKQSWGAISGEALTGSAVALTGSATALDASAVALSASAGGNDIARVVKTLYPAGVATPGAATAAGETGAGLGLLDVAGPVAIAASVTGAVYLGIKNLLAPALNRFNYGATNTVWNAYNGSGGATPPITSNYEATYKAVASFPLTKPLPVSLEKYNVPTSVGHGSSPSLNPLSLLEGPLLSSVNTPGGRGVKGIFDTIKNWVWSTPNPSTTRETTHQLTPADLGQLTVERRLTADENLATWEGAARNSIGPIPNESSVDARAMGRVVQNLTTNITKVQKEFSAGDLNPSDYAKLVAAYTAYVAEVTKVNQDAQQTAQTLAGLTGINNLAGADIAATTSAYSEGQASFQDVQQELQRTVTFTQIAYQGALHPKKGQKVTGAQTAAALEAYKSAQAALAAFGDTNAQQMGAFAQSLTQQGSVTGALQNMKISFATLSHLGGQQAQQQTINAIIQEAQTVTQNAASMAQSTSAANAAMAQGYTFTQGQTKLILNYMNTITGSLNATMAALASVGESVQGGKLKIPGQVVSVAQRFAGAQQNIEGAAAIATAQTAGETLATTQVATQYYLGQLEAYNKINDQAYNAAVQLASKKGGPSLAAAEKITGYQFHGPQWQTLTAEYTTSSKAGTQGLFQQQEAQQAFYAAATSEDPLLAAQQTMKQYRQALTAAQVQARSAGKTNTPEESQARQNIAQQQQTINQAVIQNMQSLGGEQAAAAQALGEPYRAAQEQLATATSVYNTTLSQAIQQYQQGLASGAISKTTTQSQFLAKDVALQSAATAKSNAQQTAFQQFQQKITVAQGLATAQANENPQIAAQLSQTAAQAQLNAWEKAHPGDTTSQQYQTLETALLTAKSSVYDTANAATQAELGFYSALFAPDGVLSANELVKQGEAALALAKHHKNDVAGMNAAKQTIASGQQQSIAAQITAIQAAGSVQVALANVAGQPYLAALAQQKSDTTVYTTYLAKETQQYQAMTPTQKKLAGTQQQWLAANATLTGYQATVVSDQAAAQQALVSQTTNVVESQLTLGQITSTQAISQLLTVANKVRGNQALLLQVETEIRQLQSAAGGNLSFNLPSTLVPTTLYAARLAEATNGNYAQPGGQSITINNNIYGGSPSQIQSAVNKTFTAANGGGASRNVLPNGTLR